MDMTEFRYSPLLGERAKNVYAWFLQSIALPGDIAECGVSRGETSYEFVRYLEENHINKNLHMFDTFQGLPDIFTVEEVSLALGNELIPGNFACSIEAVVERMGSYGRYKTHKGLFKDTFSGFTDHLCFIHADADMYSSTLDIIELANRCLVPGGTIVFDDYDNAVTPGVKLAIQRHLCPNRYTLLPSPTSIQCFAIKK